MWRKKVWRGGETMTVLCWNVMFLFAWYTEKWIHMQVLTCCNCVQNKTIIFSICTVLGKVGNSSQCRIITDIVLAHSHLLYMLHHSFVSHKTYKILLRRRKKVCICEIYTLGLHAIMHLKDNMSPLPKHLEVHMAANLHTLKWKFH